MTEKTNKKGGMWVVWLIFLIGALPGVGAWYLVKHPELWGSPTNHGSLIQPPVPVKYEMFHPVNDGDSDGKPLRGIYGRWVMIHVLLKEDEISCRQALDNTRRLHPLFSKDIPRVRRLAVWNAAFPPSADLFQWLKQDNDLYLAQTDRDFAARLNRAVLKQPLRCGQVILMDPLGNLMMWYDAGFDPYGLYHDLKRLLRASQIG